MGQTRLVKLRYTLPSLVGLNSVPDYIAAHSPQGARRVRADHRSSVAVSRHGHPHERSDRRMTALPHRYVTEAEIIIHAVRHSARDRSGMPDARA
jgi:toxin ParE1/3/4